MDSIPRKTQGEKKANSYIKLFKINQSPQKQKIKPELGIILPLSEWLL